MAKMSVLAWAVVSIALTADVGNSATAVADEIVSNHHRRGRLRAELRSYNEIPTLSTAGRGVFQARLSEDQTQIDFRLDYSGLEGGAATAAHIHLGARHTTGGVIIFLCGGTTPACGPSGGAGPEAAGILTAAGVVGPAGQGIAPGEFAELVKAIRAGVTYVNVHTPTYPGGETRGQINID
jgi:hypothetical protein